MRCPNQYRKSKLEFITRGCIMKWNEVKHEKVSCIEKIVAEFDIWVHQSLPFAKMKIKVKENSKSGHFKGAVAAAVRSWIVQLSYP